MASNKKASSTFTKYEKDIEKLRNENKWMRLRDYANTISIKDIKSGSITFSIF
jgi:hypothetical protein